MNSTISPEFVDLYRRPVTGPASFVSSQIKSLYDWWLEFHPMMPAMDAFDIVEHRSLAPNLFLYKILEPGKYQYRLNGEAVVSLTGASQSGRIFSLEDSDEEAQILADYLGEVISSRVPWTCGGSMAHLGKDWMRFESIDCPMAGKDGVVTHILGLMVKLDN
ncbi:PAS domain-containing protein [Aestuariispira insulae]|uniref:PAS domain-containing protein n=1 Tax=Aestuariispira insulae TaxID=1461337 RepID=A0A3D9HYW3_9PROT|nr:PAS domain-containing protein [Aestuariispira insulae]RED54096.1 PAS domain-containing protein [Aestuariispira insulae]